MYVYIYIYIYKDLLRPRPGGLRREDVRELRGGLRCLRRGSPVLVVHLEVDLLGVLPAIYIYIYIYI